MFEIVLNSPQNTFHYRVSSCSPHIVLVSSVQLEESGTITYRFAFDFIGSPKNGMVILAKCDLSHTSTEYLTYSITPKE